MRRCCYSSVSLILYILLVSHAHAATPPVPAQGWGNAYLQAAQSYWQREPSCTYAFVYDAELPQDVQAYTVKHEEQCIAYVGPMQGDSIYSRCAEVVSLYGDLLGEAPSEDIHSVMYHGGPYMAGIPSCKQLVRSVRPS